MAAQSARIYAPNDPEPLRLAIFGTPRCGNTWFRALLKTAFRLADFAEHDPADIRWDELPDRCLVNLHATPDEALRGRLEGFRSIVVARHPLDALISILHFAPHHPSSNGWLLGRGGGEDAIRGVSPTSKEFFEYATGSRAAALLSISADWWDEPGAIRVRYEDLVADAGRELERIAAELGAAPVRPIAEVVAEHAIDTMRVRDRTHQHHMWKGQPGLWKRLVTPHFARSVAGANPAAFDRPGYACDPDESLTEAQAEANWIATLAETNQRDTVQLWDLVNAMRVAGEESRCRIADLEWRLSNAFNGLDEQKAQLIRADKLIRDTNVQVDGLVRAAETRAAAAEGNAAEIQWKLDEARENIRLFSEQLVRADDLLNAANARAGIAEDRFANACQAVDRLTAQVNEYYGRMNDYYGKLKEAETRAADAEARLAGTAPSGSGVRHRLKELSTRFPWAARKAKQAVETTRRLRRAA